MFQYYLDSKFSKYFYNGMILSTLDIHSCLAKFVHKFGWIYFLDVGGSVFTQYNI